MNRNEERGDYPEVTPTAMSNFVCNRCGKPFQNPDDLARHQKFESGASRDVRIPGNKTA
ncbi:MAG: C2H2-type zinc finger protein [Nitrososphaera sp.]|uniref:C2H2-type zinc finger protein n=1 Tax=Nitrososphaera sp. TaxID=1971748 RepID=UPI003D6F23A2